LLEPALITPADGQESITLVEVKQKLSKRAIDQLGLVKDINALVVLSSAGMPSRVLPLAFI
jgi:hypothetical protein